MNRLLSLLLLLCVRTLRKLWTSFYLLADEYFHLLSRTVLNFFNIFTSQCVWLQIAVNSQTIFISIYFQDAGQYKHIIDDHGVGEREKK